MPLSKPRPVASPLLDGREGGGACLKVQGDSGITAFCCCCWWYIGEGRFLGSADWPRVYCFPTVYFANASYVPDAIPDTNQNTIDTIPSMNHDLCEFICAPECYNILLRIVTFCTISCTHWAALYVEEAVKVSWVD